MDPFTELLNSKHKRAEFNCGKAVLDTYFQKQASQDVKRRLAACFVWNDVNEGAVKGYYTLSNAGVEMKFIPDLLRRKLPSYAELPATLLGRLAVDERYQGHGTGRKLLLDALNRSYLTSALIASYAVIVDPLDDEAAGFYGRFGFKAMPDSAKMFLPTKTIQVLFTS